MSRQTKNENSNRVGTFYNTYFGTQQGSRVPEQVQLGAIKHYSDYIPKNARGQVEKDGYTVGFTVVGHPDVEVHTHLTENAGLGGTSVQNPHNHTKADERQERGRRRFSLHAEQNLLPQMAALLDGHHQARFPGQIPPVYQAHDPGPTKAEEQRAALEWANVQAEARAKNALPERPESPVSRKRELSPPREPAVPSALNLSQETEPQVKKPRQGLSPLPTIAQPQLQPQLPLPPLQTPQLAAASHVVPTVATPQLQQVRAPISFQLNIPAKRPTNLPNAFFK